jgi:hypothetical protein
MNDHNDEVVGDAVPNANTEQPGSSTYILDNAMERARERLGHASKSELA